MRGLARIGAPLAIALTLVLQGTAVAASSVSMVGTTPGTFAFSPVTVKTSLGSTVTWTNMSNVLHTATSDSTDPYTWDTGSVSVGSSSSPIVFSAAGSFPYHCSFHPTIMMGTVRAPMKASPASGVLGTTFKITWATAAPAPGSNLVFEVQKKDPGGSFMPWQTDVTTLKTMFTPTATGTYSFRAQVKNTVTGATSGFSSAKSITVT